MTKKPTIPTILGVIILAAGTFLGAFFLNSKQIFRIGASGESAPKDIRVSNITDSGFTVNFITDKEVTSYVLWGKTESTATTIEKEDANDSKYYIHSINVSGLSPKTTYYYKIVSAGATFDNQGIPWQVTTGASIGSTTSSSLISGSVLTASGAPVSRAIVYANIAGYLLSTLTSTTGNYVFQLASVRTPDLSQIANINPASTLVELSVQAGPTGISSAQIYPQSGNPTPAMVIGKVHDFKNLPKNADGQTPTADLTLPETSSSASKFNVTESLETPKPTTVILENVDDGETINSTKPEFMGKGPAGITVNILVESENPISSEVTVPTDGSWTWTPPTNLAPGNHTITLTWKDVTGITRSLTRSFVVQAAEGPAFVASESGTLLTPTPTVRATSTPRASVTATASAIPVPETGSLTPTVVLSIMGVAVVAFSFAVWKIAENA